MLLVRPRSSAVIAIASATACAVANPLGPSVGGSTDAATTIADASAPACGPPIDPAPLVACCDDPGNAHCVPDELVPTHLRASLDACASGGLCVPDSQITNQPPRACKSIGGVDGACTSLCIPAVRNAANVLPTEGCNAGERCAPCTNPTDGTSTGACEPTCRPSGGNPDSGPRPDAGMVARCCGGIGTCLPITIVGDDAARLGLDVCPSDAGLVCVPDVFLDGTFTPPSCNTSLIAALFGAAYRPGACLPGCIPAVAGALFVAQDGCGTGFKCAPCLDPITAKPSGACEPL